MLLIMYVMGAYRTHDGLPKKMFMSAVYIVKSGRPFCRFIYILFCVVKQWSSLRKVRMWIMSSQCRAPAARLIVAPKQLYSGHVDCL